MSDRLEEIKKGQDWSTNADMDWLVAEIERLRIENRRIKNLVVDALDAADNINEDLESEPWKSLKEAIKL